MARQYHFRVDEASQRIDKYLAGKLTDCSRSFLQQLIKEGRVNVNNKPVKASYKTEKNDKITVTVPTPKPLSLTPQNIPLNILYEDNDIIVVNKPAGIVVHPAAGNHEGTLVNALLYHANSLSGINGVLRPGIVHRLDKDTTGCLVVAKNDKAHKSLSGQFKQKSIYKEYLAIIEGTIPKMTTNIKSFIKRDARHRKKMAANKHEGKIATTECKIIEKLKNFSLVKLIPKTGRTHQIRVHLSSIGHPIIGDTVYKGHKSYKNFRAKRYMLHAYALHFWHPTQKKNLQFKADIPEDMLTILKNLGVSYALSEI